MVTPVAYFKRIQGRRQRKVISYLKVMNDGRIYTINVTEMRTSTIRTFGSIGLELFESTQAAWDNAYIKLKKHLDNDKKTRA